MENIMYVEFTAANFYRNSLDDFKRRQEVKNCWRKVGNGYILLPVSYTEDWTLSERRNLAEKIVRELSSGSRAFGAIIDGKTVGFALIIGKRFGSENQYVDLAELHVSEPYRRKGIGKTLFQIACDAAKELGGTKLYISAHSAEESIAAYKSYGCTLAKEINRTLAEKEPCDLQLEYRLK
ncbi:MAG: GNAT family N-acetyltransferase [Corallococcus sp.]|nr:GNAT family N-acetyltransferase [Corallococcus sp.]MCM1359415.1 GNAT family N-acetyltransferase [Corallococcus sp.]MCM1394858.1 GNAT family N-acetyltransferase [Corallococcus sp.]